jgi:Methyltransferase domain
MMAVCDHRSMVGEPGGDRDREMRANPRSWRPPQWPISGRKVGMPPLSRWETVLGAERDFRHQLALRAARSRLLRRFLRLPRNLSEPAGPTLDDRERGIADARRMPLAKPIAPSGPDEHGEGERPPLGPLLDREVDRALALLADMPFEELQDRGWHLQPNSYPWPLNDVHFLRDNPDLWMRRSLPQGIEWDLDGQEELARRLAHHAHELGDVPDRIPDHGAELTWHNGLMSSGDIYAYYGLVRELGPRRVIEVGSGWSSLVLARALVANDAPVAVTLIEPTPNQALLAEFRPQWKLVPHLVQHVDVHLFEELEAGDLLFYDGSHVTRTGGDLNWMLFDVLPRLSPGVWVHFHDLFWPNDYPSWWILDEGITWNEQYVLQAFLMHNQAYRVRLATKMLWLERREALAPLFEAGFDGGSLWLEKVA